jgi:hypothetical protein
MENGARAARDVGPPSFTASIKKMKFFRALFHELTKL